MPKIKHKYSGSNHTRIINAEDLLRHGVTDHSDTSWSPENGHVAEVSSSTATWLLENEKGDWEIINDDASSEGDAESTSGAGEESVMTTEADDASSTSRRRPSR